MASVSTTNGIFQSLGGVLKQSDSVLAIGILLVLVVMLVPIPPFILDILFSSSITLSLLVLLTSMFILSPLEFSIFPTLLLVATLLRLALNVASTRLILLNGASGPDSAGSVIASFGEFVVGGSYIVGAVVFLILFILNKVVITTGTTRIAEVAARFTLDSLPGKQMAIEADLNAGLIDEKEAVKRRDEIRRESDFYGAMDGAGKFVQGDVTAGLIITFINFIGGILIGMIRDGLTWQESISTYTLLTIGDGLVSTIPSIIVSTSAGIIVSRAASSAKMGDEFASQLTNNPKALALVGSVMLVLALIPGMPKMPFFLLTALLFGGYYVKTRLIPKDTENSDVFTDKGDTLTRNGEQDSDDNTLETPESVQALLPLNILELEVGYGLIPLVDEKQEGTLLRRIRAIRKQIALEKGVIVPSLHLRDNLQLRPGQYCVLIKGNEIASAEIMTDSLLAMNAGNVQEPIEGTPTVEPAFKLPAVWIPKSTKDIAISRGYTVVDPTTVITTHLTEIINNSLSQFLNRQEVQILLDNLAKRAPKAVEELVPGILSLGTVQKVLQNLVIEKVSIRDLLTIVESLADYGAQIKNPDILTEYVRERLALTIVKPYLTAEGTLHVLTLEPATEKILQDSLRQNEGATFFAVQPTILQKLIGQIKQSLDSPNAINKNPVLLISPIVRPHLAKLLLRFLPGVAIISQAEIPPQVRLQSLGSIGID